jgi:hypothetical protein
VAAESASLLRSGPVGGSEERRREERPTPSRMPERKCSEMVGSLMYLFVFFSLLVLLSRAFASADRRKACNDWYVDRIDRISPLVE